MPPATSFGLAPSHPLREQLAAEVHARPPEALPTPSRATYVAVMIEPARRAEELAHLAALCAAHDAQAPAADARHHSARLGTLTMKWERHTEFSSYIFILPGQSPLPFSEPPVLHLPEGWMAGVPGQVIVAAHGKIVRTPTDPIDAAFLARHFGGHTVVGGTVGDGAGVAYTDFRIHADGYSRFLMIDHALTARQAGRMMQRLFEIEAYRTMALLALPVAREAGARLAEIEAALAALTGDIAAGTGNDEALLQQVTRLAAGVESALGASQFRFGACRAYADLVAARLAELREGRIPGLQPIGEFMARRFTPAVSTCATTAARLQDLSERVARASALLSTRVDIARERQNQALLASLERRGRMQLRLQETVEGLSVAAIVYYAAGLVGYLAKGAKAAGAPIEPDKAIGLAIPVLAAIVYVATRRARRRALVEEHRRGPSHEEF